MNRRIPLLLALVGGGLVVLPLMGGAGVLLLAFGIFVLGNLGAYHGGADWSAGELSRFVHGVTKELVGPPDEVALIAAAAVGTGALLLVLSALRTRTRQRGAGPVASPLPGRPPLGRLLRDRDGRGGPA